MKRPAILALAAAAVLAACDGFKEAMSAHTDVVARAGNQELSVTRLSELLGNSKIPLQKDFARAVADLWVSYQLLGRAAANGDSLADQKLIDDVMWARLAESRMKKLYDQVSRTWDTTAGGDIEARYNQGEILSARHILFGAPQQGLTAASRDSIRRRAEAVRAQVNAGNFAAMAKQHSMDPGSKDNGGLYPAFPRGMMVADFEKALVALPPGGISPLVATDFGYHIIYRPRFAEVANEVRQALAGRTGEVAESTYMAGIEKGGKVEIKPNAATVTKNVAKNPETSRDDKTVIATSTAGDLTAGRLARWISAYPPQAQITSRLQQAPDSQVVFFVRNVVRNELLLKQADSAKIVPDTGDVNAVRGQFRGFVQSAWNGLGIAPQMLADSGRTPGEREKVASGRVERYLDALVAESQQIQFVPVPEPLKDALREKYDAKISDAGLDRAMERAGKIRTVADSTRAAQQPQSQVPMPPGMQGGPPMPQGAPMPQGQPQQRPPQQRPPQGQRAP
jgi:peptidyl-prolyl cis-trans isomerase D